MTQVFAVKYPNDHWRIAEKVKAAAYAAPHGLVANHPDWDVWSEAGTTAFIGYVGNGETVVDLPSVGDEMEADGD